MARMPSPLDEILHGSVPGRGPVPNQQLVQNPGAGTTPGTGGTSTAGGNPTGEGPSDIPTDAQFRVHNPVGTTGYQEGPAGSHPSGDSHTPNRDMPKRENPC